MSKSMKPVANKRVDVTRQRLKTPRAAAIAGIIFAVLFSASLVLLKFTLPTDLNGADTASRLQGNSGTVSVALLLVPFAGIAFLWFIGVVRDRLGNLEDQFFATVFFGSGLLFLAMIFVAAAVAGGIVTSYAISPDVLVQSGVITFGRALMYTVLNIYAIRMAAVFMIALGTIWIRTRVMPRLFVFLTYGLALVMLITVDLSLWLLLLFPLWVFVISLYILFISLRGETAEADEILGASEE